MQKLKPVVTVNFELEQRVQSLVIFFGFSNGGTLMHGPKRTFLQRTCVARK